MVSMAQFKSVNEAWEYWYNQLAMQNGSSASRDGAVTGEIINAVTVIDDPKDNLVTSPIRKLSHKYAIGELLWYLSGSNKLDAIANYSKAWNKLSDDGETVNSAYGHRIFEKFGFDQWEHVKELLKADPNSRQAVIHIKEPNPEKTKDLPCTVALQYFIRDGKLYATTYMRSNDIWLGLPYDMAFFTVLLQKVCTATELPCGKYYHTVGDLHLYEKHWNRPVGKTDELDLGEAGWDYTEETFPSIAKILEGEMPDSHLLRRLWRINNAKK